MTRIRVGLVLLSVVLVATACGTRADPEKDVPAAIRRTEREPRGIAYEEVLADGTTTRVDLLITDDYRYKAQVTVDGRAALDVVVRDDALAVRVIDIDAAAEAVGEAVAAATGGATGGPAAPGLPVVPGAPAVPAAATGGEGEAGPAALAPPSREVIQALETRNWVTDPTGAPELFSATAGRVLEEGEGGIIAPVLEALRGLQTIENAVQQAQEVTRFNEENPNYDPSAETFPKPERGSAVLRYDLFAPQLPNPNQSLNAGSSENLPDEQHFRRMAIYVKNRQVVNVLESIEINPRLLDDIEGRFDIPLPDNEEEAAAIAVETLNGKRTAAGLDPIEIRTLSLEILDVPGTEAVILPTDGTVGNLKSLVQVRTKEASSAG
ncbi:MAG TPA: hypothetical protein VMY88_00910 [Acidimicrobiales bacterium]|nr:hypothetical protein [Acidimicrobiales bacterium]